MTEGNERQAIGTEQPQAVNKWENGILERLRRERKELKKEAYNYGDDYATEFLKSASYAEIKAIVEGSEFENWRPDYYAEWDGFHEEIRENEYDEEECYRGFVDRVKEIYKKM